MLKLCEQMMLLGLNDDSGALVFTIRTQLPYAIAGATVFDLYYKGFISIKDDNIIINNKGQNKYKFLDYSLNQLAQSEKALNIETVMNRLSAVNENINNLILESLVDRGILKKESHKLLWVINYDRYPTSDPVPERDIRKNIRDIVLNDKIPNNRDLILISLIGACDLTNEIFSYEEREIASEKISILSDEEFIEQFISINESILNKTITTVIRKSYSTTLK